MLFCGFNAFQQFGRLPSKTATPTDIKLPFNNVEILAADWSYNVFAKGKQLALYGFLQGKSNSSLLLEAPGDIKQLSTNDRFCLILLDNGKLFKIEIKSKIVAMIEVKLAGTSAQHRKRSIFGEKLEMEPDQVTHIASGTNITVAITKANSVYNIPSKIHQFPQHVKVNMLQCGFEHALVLTNNGDLFAWGNGMRGQLGSDTLCVEEEPKLVEALAGLKICCIAVGGWHNAAVSAFGDVYTWGFNSNGQLGLRVFKESQNISNLKLPAVFPLPQLIDLSECCSCESNQGLTCSVTKVFAGARHTILQMSCGSFLAAGWNAHGQIALSCYSQDIDQFKKLSSESIPKDSKLNCGPWCTIFSS